MASLAWPSSLSPSCALLLCGLLLSTWLKHSEDQTSDFLWSKWVKNCTRYIHWHLIAKSIVTQSQEAAMAAGKMSTWVATSVEGLENRFKGTVRIHQLDWLNCPNPIILFIHSFIWMYILHTYIHTCIH